MGGEDEKRDARTDDRTRQQRQPAWANQDSDRSAVTDSRGKVAGEDRKVCVARLCWFDDAPDQRLCDAPDARRQQRSFRRTDRTVSGGQNKDQNSEAGPGDSGRAAVRDDRSRRRKAAHL